MKTFLPFFAALIICTAPAIANSDNQHASLESGKNAPTYLMIKFSVSEGRLPDFLSIMTDINTLMASEEGFISAQVYRNADHPLSFTLIEKWQSRTLHKKHYDAIVAAGDWANILAMLSAEPEMSYNAQL
ncbi:MAG: antibiotic biosynthesis monooxygenase family protein [Pseudomonadota bacterium]